MTFSYYYIFPASILEFSLKSFIKMVEILIFSILKFRIYHLNPDRVISKADPKHWFLCKSEVSIYLNIILIIILRQPFMLRLVIIITLKSCLYMNFYVEFL